mmetsp:Transcript_22387/g.44815  ORF Transcript_22387/g.44815 Transcript_22387/m.44815 type:complete len:128 (+) Transcript_22387:2066-2449(+)
MLDACYVMRVAPDGVVCYHYREGNNDESKQSSDRSDTNHADTGWTDRYGISNCKLDTTNFYKTKSKPSFPTRELVDWTKIVGARQHNALINYRLQLERVDCFTFILYMIIFIQKFRLTQTIARKRKC